MNTPHQAGVVETVSVTAGRMPHPVDGTEHPVESRQTATFDGDAPTPAAAPAPKPAT